MDLQEQCLTHELSVRLERVDQRNQRMMAGNGSVTSTILKDRANSSPTSVSVNDKDFSHIVEEFFEDSVVDDDNSNMSFTEGQPAESQEQELRSSEGFHEGDNFDDSVRRNYQNDRTDQIHDSALQKDRAKRLEYLLKQAEVFSHFMRPTYCAALDTEGERNGGDKSDSVSNGGSLSARNKFAKKPKKAMKLLISDGKNGDNKDEQTQIPTFDANPHFIANGTMRDYQIRGLNWLISLYENGINGVLADEMGLGKTIQTISLLGYLKHDRNIPGPHLVIVPKSTLSNWMGEFEKWCPTLKVICLIGSKDERPSFFRNVFYKKKWNVCVTSYEMVLAEISKLKKVNWLYVIIDEAQRIKNDGSKLATYARILKSKNRLILTGTPLQNNLHELWALLNYLLPDVFDSSEDFDSWFNATDCINNTSLVNRLHGLLRPFLLRRIKSDVEKGLPPKKEILLYVPIAPLQRDWYRQVLMKDINCLNSFGDVRKTSIRNLIMHLRKVCNHPYLFPAAEPGPPFTTDQHIVSNCGKMIVLDKLLRRLKEEGSRVLLFCQMTRMLDILEDFCLWRGYDICRLDGNTDHDLRQEHINEFNAPNSKKFMFLISTRAGGLGINLATADVVVLYDSDWNPQVDLQAQDRCHRIGQTKEVRVFRLITENTVEEKILERAEIKMRLDRQVIQRGRLVDSGKTYLDKHSLHQIVRFGADRILQGQSKSTVSLDEDIDSILKKSKEKSDSLAQQLSCLQEGSLKNLVVEETSASLPTPPKDFHTFEGQDFRILRAQAIEENKSIESFIEDDQRKRPVKSIYARSYFDDEEDDDGNTSRHTRLGKRNLRNALSRPTCPNDFQFFPHRSFELYYQELDSYRHKTDFKVEKLDSEELFCEDLIAIQEFEQSRISKVVPLSKTQIEEKAALEAEGFPKWTRRHFRRYLKQLSLHGKDNLNDIANSVAGVTAEEVVTYHQVFDVRCHEIFDYETIFTNFGLHALISECTTRIQTLLEMKIQQQNSKKRFTIKYPPSLQDLNRFTRKQDKFLLLTLHKLGLNERNVYDFKSFHSKILEGSENDLFLRARTPEELHARCMLLLHLIELEFSNSQPSQNSSLVEMSACSEDDEDCQSENVLPYKSNSSLEANIEIPKDINIENNKTETKAFINIDSPLGSRKRKHVSNCTDDVQSPMKQLRQNEL